MRQLLEELCALIQRHLAAETPLPSVAIGDVKPAPAARPKRDRSHKNHNTAFNRADFPPELIKHYFYEIDGRVYRRVNTYSGGIAGDECGTADPTRQAIVMFDGFRFPRSHIVFVLAHGRWPRRKIFHRNFDRTDDRPGNICEATNSEICRSAKVMTRNVVGVKGVSLDLSTPNRPSRTSICREGIIEKLGSYETASECHQVYAAKAAEYHGTFNPASSLYRNKDTNPNE